MLYLRFVRSPYAHARIVSIDTSAADALAGVVCTLTGEEIAKQTNPFIEIGPPPADKIRDYSLALGKVRYQGEPVAAVAAESARLADDAAELIQVEYEALNPVLDAEDALTDKSVLHEECAPTESGMVSLNTVTSRKLSKTPPMSSRLTASTFTVSRPRRSRTNVAIGQWDPKDQRIYYWCNNSFPSFAIQFSLGAP